MKNLADYLSNRRSALSVTLEEPGPDAATIRAMVTIASRVPDHGKLAPWRFEVWDSAFRTSLHRDLVASVDDGAEGAAKRRAETDKLLHGPCVIAVISTAAEHPKIPIWEQHLSAGASCLALLMAANAFGFEAQWLTAWYVYAPEAQQILGLSEGERLAGLIHVGTSGAPKQERDRPDIDTILTHRKA